MGKRSLPVFRRPNTARASVACPWHPDNVHLSTCDLLKGPTHELYLVSTCLRWPWYAWAMRSLAPFAIAIAVLSFGSLATAQTDSTSGKKVRTDPKGVTGISPYNETLAKGRKAFVEKRVDEAIASFRSAIQKEPQKMLAYLLLAQAQHHKGKVDAALKTVEDGRKKQGSEANDAKMLFLRADLLERKAAATKEGGGKSLAAALAGAWEQAKEGWSAYKVFLDAHSRLPDYKASAVKRKEAIDLRAKRAKDYGEVRARIDKNAKARLKKK